MADHVDLLFADICLFCLLTLQTDNTSMIVIVVCTGKQLSFGSIWKVVWTRTEAIPFLAEIGYECKCDLDHIWLLRYRFQLSVKNQIF